MLDPQQRQYLIGVCYRLLGSVAEAEDIVQDAWLRWHNAGRPQLDVPRAWFTRVCTRLCLDRLRSAHVQRESYPGQWLPEPLVDDAISAGRDESISLALMLAVQKLSPKERAAFILHDVFGYSFDEVAGILEMTADACRQSAFRARRHLQDDRPRFDARPDTVEQLTTSFFDALRTGDLDGLRTLLADEVRLISDGGGQVPAAPVPIVGSDKVHRFLSALYRQVSGVPVDIRPLSLNGATSAVITVQGQAPSVFQLAIKDDRVDRIFVQRNPDKLTRILAAVGDRNLP